MNRRGIAATFDQLVEAFADEEVFNTQSYLDGQTGEIVTIATDLLDYCLGHREGTDLQLSDSHELPAAQAVAGELLWLERGFDEEGLPFGPEDRRYFPTPRLGPLPRQEIERELEKWLEEWSLSVDRG